MHIKHMGAICIRFLSPCCLHALQVICLGEAPQICLLDVLCFHSRAFGFKVTSMDSTARRVSALLRADRLFVLSAGCAKPASTCWVNDQLLSFPTPAFKCFPMKAQISACYYQLKIHWTSEPWISNRLSLTPEFLKISKNEKMNNT